MLNQHLHEKLLRDSYCPFTGMEKLIEKEAKQTYVQFGELSEKVIRKIQIICMEDYHYWQCVLDKINAIKLNKSK